MSTSRIPLAPTGNRRHPLEIVRRKSTPLPETGVRLAFWITGIVFAVAQAGIFRFHVSADSISYLDMSDAVIGGDWQRLINGIWSPLYPLLLGTVRSLFRIAPAEEIAAAHIFNIALFVFAFACFEFFLRSIAAQTSADAEPDRRLLPLPPWAFLSLAYSLILWASISAISVRDLRPDMLMSGFLYTAVGLVLRMRAQPATWRRFIILGIVLGVGFLAKEPMLPIGILLIAISVAVVMDWRPALKMAATAIAMMLLIGALYFVPLSRSRGHFTLGESGSFNYLAYVDGAGPNWYMQYPGRARGTFSRPAEKIFTAPPAYAFPHTALVTHPLRFDPSEWIAGVRPRFVLIAQIRAVIRNGLDVGQSLVAVLVFIIALGGAWLLSGRRVLWDGLRATWPAALIGAAGICMYVLIHVEPRYVAAFLVLFFVSIMAGIGIPARFSNKLANPVILVCISLLLPIASHTYIWHSQGIGRFDADAQAAATLASLGIGRGDLVARISPVVNDLGIERIARVEVIAEVDNAHANEFWAASESTQKELLSAFAARGAKAVIATMPHLSQQNSSEWKQLGSTRYWVWQPAG